MTDGAIVATGPAVRQTPHDEPLARPSLVFAAVDLFGKLVAFGVVVVLSRRLTDAGFGDVVASLAMAGVLLAFLDFGMNLKLVALVVRGRSELHEAVARRYQALGAVLLGASGAILVPGVRPFALCMAAAAAMAALPTGALLAGRAPAWAGWSLVGPNVVFLGLLILLPESGPQGAMALWTVANLLVLASLWKAVPWVRPLRHPAVGLWHLHRSSASIAVFNLAVLSYGRVDTVLVGVFGGAAVAGVYGTAYRVVLSVVGLASWSANIAARRLAATEDGPDELRRVLRFSASLAVLSSLGLLVALDPLLALVLGRRPALPAAVLWPLAALPLPLMLINPIACFLVISGRQRHMAARALCVGALAVVLYPAAIGRWGASGAAVSSLAVEVTALAVFAAAIPRSPAVATPPVAAAGVFAAPAA